MDPERLLESIIRGALGGRKKRAKGALRYLAGGRGSLVNAGTLLAAAGVAWGLYETLANQQGSATPAPAAPQPAPGAAPPAWQATPPPPLPTGGSAMPDTGLPPGVTPEMARAIRLTISAARADGTLTPAEESTILEQARAVGAEEFVRGELARPTPIASLLAGARPESREDLYRLAFAIVRADETVSGAERIYLAQVAHQLGLAPDATTRIEQQAAAGIDAAGAATAGEPPAST